MNINPFEIVETNGKRLKTGLLLIFNRVDENNIVDIYAMRIYNCYASPKGKREKAKFGLVIANFNLN